MISNLAFLQTWSVPQFKANNGLDSIEIKKNERTGKCFFTSGVLTGVCSQKADTGELTLPVISQVAKADTGETFFMLHQKGEGSATTLATL
jgi:hypothetical protein